MVSRTPSGSARRSRPGRSSWPAWPSWSCRAGAGPDRARRGARRRHLLRLNQGPHGLTEILYAFTSQANNNGSAFAGLTGNTAFYNLTGSLAMYGGRYLPILAVLAIAGSLAAKEVPAGPHLPNPHPAVRRPAGQRGPDHRRPDLLPGPRPWPDRRAPAPGHRPAVLRGNDANAQEAVRALDRPRRCRRGVPQARPADPGPQPGDVRGAGRQRPGHPAVRCQPGQRRRAGRHLVHRPGGAVAVVHGAVRQLRRGDGRGRGKAQADELRKARRDTTARRLRSDGSTEVVPASQPGRATR